MIGVPKVYVRIEYPIRYERRQFTLVKVYICLLNVFCRG